MQTQTKTIHSLAAVQKSSQQHPPSLHQCLQALLHLGQQTAHSHASAVSDMDAYIAHCQKRGYAVATINRRLAALSAFYQVLQTHTDEPPPNPIIPRRRFIKQGRRLPRDVVDSDRDSCIQFDYLLTAGYTGLMTGSTVADTIKIPGDQIAAFCRRYHIRRLALFGSALRDDFRPHSDLDMLVEFEPGHIPGLAFFTIQEELSRLLGRPVDLNTLPFISPHFRQEVQAEAEIIYDQT